MNSKNKVIRFGANIPKMQLINFLVSQIITFFKIRNNLISIQKEDSKRIKMLEYFKPDEISGLAKLLLIIGEHQASLYLEQNEDPFSENYKTLLAEIEEIKKNTQLGFEIDFEFGGRAKSCLLQYV